MDHRRLEALLDDVADREWEHARAREHVGASKLWLVHRLLQHRTARPDRCASGYRPIEAEGAKADHAVAFSRDDLVVVVPRLIAGRAGGWAGTRLPLPAGAWRDALTGRQCTGAVPLDDLLSTVPVAVLEPEPRP